MSRFQLWASSESASQSSKEDTADPYALDHSFQSPAKYAKRCFYAPLHYETRYDYPLIVWLHSDGHNENQVTQVIPYISIRNYIAVGTRATRATDSAGHRYEWRRSVAAIAAAHEEVLSAIEDAQNRFSVHSKRVVLAGYKTGGTMALRIAQRDPSRFAGVISLGGPLPQGFRSLGNLDELRQRRLPMLWQYAMQCPSYSESSLQSDLRSVSITQAQLEVRKYTVDDEMDKAILSEMNDWIMSRVVANSTETAKDHWATTPTQFSSN